MIAETIYYITGSIFFVIVIAVFLVTAYIWLKILKNIEKMSDEVKSTAFDIRGKISNLYFGFAGLTALLEKMMDFVKDRKKDKENKESDEADASPEPCEEKSETKKKEKKAKKIRVVEVSEE